MSWPESRPETYEVSSVWDEETSAWVADDGRGGARLKNNLIIIAQNDDGDGRIFVSE